MMKTADGNGAALRTYSIHLNRTHALVLPYDLLSPLYTSGFPTGLRREMLDSLFQWYVRGEVKKMKAPAAHAYVKAIINGQTKRMAES
jgi:hypothetical protein